MLVLRYYTDLDVEPYEDADGRYALYDALESHGAWNEIWNMVSQDMSKVMDIYFFIMGAARETFAAKHSIGHMVKQTLQSVLGTEDIATSFAKAQEINSSLIDMMGAFRREQSKKPGGGIVNFAKRDR